MTRLTAPPVLAGLTLALLLGAACGGSGGSGAGDGLGGTITVYAAASLQQPFERIGREMEAANPRLNVRFNFGGSPQLRTQLEQGGHADVFAAADERQMDLASDGGVLASAPRVFARNRLVVVVPPSNPGRVESFADLAKPGVKLDLAGPEVPAGRYAREALEAASADPAYGADFARRALANVVSEEENVKAVVAKVQLGEADAGIVYASDVTPSLAADVRAIAIPDAFNQVAAYPIALVKGGDAQLGQAFIDYLRSDAGQAALRNAGFLSP